MKAQRLRDQGIEPEGEPEGPRNPAMNRALEMKQRIQEDLKARRN